MGTDSSLHRGTSGVDSVALQVAVNGQNVVSVLRPVAVIGTVLALGVNGNLGGVGIDGGDDDANPLTPGVHAHAVTVPEGNTVTVGVHA